MFGGNDSVHWFCKRCNSGILKVLKTVGRLDEKVVQVTREKVAQNIKNESFYKYVQSKIKVTIGLLEDCNGLVVGGDKEMGELLNSFLVIYHQLKLISRR